MKGYLLDAQNLTIKATNWIKASLGLIRKWDTTDALPLGDTVGDGTGQIGVKIISLGTTGSSNPATATVNNVTSNAVSQQLHAANSFRKGLSIKNHADKVLHIAFTNPATASNSIVDLAAETAGVNGGYWEVPYGYTGLISGYWETGPTGTANIVEYTA